MHDNTSLQLAHFARIQHDRRFIWQTQDAFVIQREHQTIAPLADVLRRHEKGGVKIRVLESGCGEGVNLIHLHQMGFKDDLFEMQGIDSSPEAIAEATKHGLKVSLANGLSLPYPDASFDVVFTRDVFHHLGNDGERLRFFQEMKRVAKPGGFIVVIEPNPWNPMLLAFSFLIRAERGIRTGAEYNFRRLFPGVDVCRVTPSAAWRGWYHYRSPLRDWMPAAIVTRNVLRVWEWMCERVAPSWFWAWRVYVWESRSDI